MAQFKPRSAIKLSRDVTSSTLTVSNDKNLKNSGTAFGFETTCYNYLSKYLANYKFNIVFSPSKVI